MQGVFRPRSILVYVGVDLVGDGLMKLPFLRALRSAFPAAHITWLAGKGKTVYASILAPLIVGLVDEVIEDVCIGNDWREIFAKPLKNRFFDLIIDTQRRLKTTLAIRKIPHRQFVSGTMYYLFSDFKPKDRRKKRRMVDALFDLIFAVTKKPVALDLKITIPNIYRETAKEILPNNNYVGLAPGAGGKHKCWPLENYIALGLQLLQKKLSASFYFRTGRITVG